LGGADLRPSFSDYIVFVDESGDHGLQNIDPQFPVFTLAFCIVAKEDYLSAIVPAFQKFKFDFFGHDGVILHEHELRKSEGPFAFLRTDASLRGNFFAALNEIVDEAVFRIYAATIHKDLLKARYSDPWNPYEIALRFCMEHLRSYMLSAGQKGKTLHLHFEGRGRREDQQLELEFRRICANQGQWGWKAPDFTVMKFEPVFLPKSANSIGLQMADLIARPIALHSLRPQQANRAYDVLKTKIRYAKGFP
jgi:hypothetical protein